jgi:hypothetical protein
LRCLGVVLGRISVAFVAAHRRQHLQSNSNERLLGL